MKTTEEYREDEAQSLRNLIEKKVGIRKVAALLKMTLPESDFEKFHSPSEHRRSRHV